MSPSRVSRPVSRVLLALLPIAAVAMAVPPSSSAATGLPCGDQADGRTRCARVVVPLDRTGAVPGKVGLSVRTIQVGVRTKKVRRGAVLFIAGGPGQAATSLASDYSMVLKPLLRRRDLLTVDTRGIGRATDLIVCPELETGAVTGLSEPESFRSCASRLGPGIDHYGTEDTVADLEAVRAASGYDKLLVVGVSYGTYTAQRYAAEHPDRVSGLILDSTVDATGDDPFSVATFPAITRSLRNACLHRACRGITPDPARDLARTRDRLPLTAEVDDGEGRRRAATVDAATLFSLVQAGDLDPKVRINLPSVLRSAATGDPVPLVRLAREAGLVPVPGDDEDPEAAPAAAASISTGSSVATICRDTHEPWAPGTPLGAPRRAAALQVLAAMSDEARGGWTPEQLVDLTPPGLCAEWPGAPDDLPIGPPADVPTLLLSGQDDTRTSPAEARRVAARIPGSTLLTVPVEGHSVLAAGRGCVVGALKAFSAGKPIGRCRRPSTVVPNVAVAPARVAALGRTATQRARAVARLTIIDAARSSLLSGNAGDGELVISLDEPDPVRLAGLRSGFALLNTDTGELRLKRMGFVPGTAVSGLVGEGRRVRVTVRGEGLREGTFTMANPLTDAKAVFREIGVDPKDLLGLSARAARAIRTFAARRAG